MKVFRLILPVLLLGSLSADPPSQPPLTFTPGTAGTWNADWEGVDYHRTYFLQWSFNLTDWFYAPFVDHGAGLKSRGIQSSTPKFFVRLWYDDIPGINSLEAAVKADFDNDGLSNLFEVEVGSFSPHAADTDGNSVDDTTDFPLGAPPAALLVFTPLQ